MFNSCKPFPLDFEVTSDEKGLRLTMTIYMLGFMVVEGIPSMRD